MSDLELIDVEKSFGDFAAVRGVMLRIEQGEFVSLLGPSGSGKTTTLRIIAGFEDPTSGDLRIGGVSVVGQRADKRGVGIVFQSYALFPQMNVFENVAYGLRAQRLRGEAVRKRVHEMLELVGLGALHQRRIHELSGGQQQRVALARALAVRPRVLLLDEPLGALDKKLREQMELALMELHREIGMTMVYVTHDQDEALSMSQRVAVMKDGQIEQFDTPDRLYYEPASRYICEFVGRTNILAASVGSHRGPLTITSTGLAARTRDVLAPGRACLICIRPEHLIISGPEAAAPNAQPGRIIERVFLGQTTNYIIELGSGERVEASVFSDASGLASGHGGELHAVGDSVSVGFEAEHGLMFEHEGTAPLPEARNPIEVAAAP